MIKKRTEFIHKQLRGLIEKDRGWRESSALETALQVTEIIVRHLMRGRASTPEGGYRGPKCLEKYLSGFWGEGEKAEKAFKEAARIETVVTVMPMPCGEHGIEVMVNFFKSGQGQSAWNYGLAVQLNDGGYVAVTPLSRRLNDEPKS